MGRDHRGDERRVRGVRLRVLVCGDRNWRDRDSIAKRLVRLSPDTVIVHGAARGADTIAGEEAVLLGMAVESHPAEWERYGRSAGPIRNRLMLKTGVDLVIAFHPDLQRSRGTADMVRVADRAGVPVEVHNQ